VVWLKGMRSTTQKKFGNFFYEAHPNRNVFTPSLG
jgi:hypothetical protein